MKTLNKEMQAAITPSMALKILKEQQKMSPFRKILCQSSIFRILACHRSLNTLSLVVTLNNCRAASSGQLNSVIKETTTSFSEI